MTHDPMHTQVDEARVRFDALIAQRQRAPFAWGQHDCCLFAADAVLALTGSDPAAAWRGAYSDAAGAARLLAELGGVRAIAAAHGREIRPLAARLGDVGVLEHDGRDLLAVCAGDVWLAPAAGQGLTAAPLDAALAAWRVGDA